MHFVCMVLCVRVCSADSSASGVTASVACPMACETLCGIDYDECLSKPCQHGGTCVESNTDISVNREKFMCTCTSLWTGEACELGVSALSQAHSAPSAIHSCAGAYCYAGAYYYRQACKDSTTWHSNTGSDPCSNYVKTRRGSTFQYCSTDKGRSPGGNQASWNQSA